MMKTITILNHSFDSIKLSISYNIPLIDTTMMKSTPFFGPGIFRSLSIPDQAINIIILIYINEGTQVCSSNIRSSEAAIRGLTKVYEFIGFKKPNALIEINPYHLGGTNKFLYLRNSTNSFFKCNLSLAVNIHNPNTSKSNLSEYKYELPSLEPKEKLIKKDLIFVIPIYAFLVNIFLTVIDSKNNNIEEINLKTIILNGIDFPKAYDIKTNILTKKISANEISPPKKIFKT
ncbi:hypothetical protein [Clostridium tarantellae]|uniref:Uncharacterized protein n=1 Tax=Clostridium tarantellae TaxID=39493 RepID=A0A6I1MNS0_9CLOT|nr:hypothetical protein [Clostridium tarantellae]MPQ43912.1 hypothetical protein [Clostridium tarantellae]